MTPRWPTLAALAALLGGACVPGEGDDAPVGDEGDSTVVVARKVAFAGEDDGVSEGFDLDGVATGTGDGTGCGIPDFVGVDGTPGIDNSMAGLMPIIELTGGQALPDLVQNAVFQGELVLIFEVGEPDRDGCVPLDVVRGAEPPAVGTDGQVLPGQTFVVDHEQPSGRVACLRDVGGGVLRGSGLELRLPLHVFDETIDVTMRDATVQLAPGDDATWRLVVSGGVSTQELVDNVLGFDALPESLIGAVTTALGSRGDLDGPEGACTAMSTTLVMEAVPAFVFEGDTGVE